MASSIIILMENRLVFVKRLFKQKARVSFFRQKKLFVRFYFYASAKIKSGEYLLFLFFPHGENKSR
jgi:hypothetical protein